MSRRYCSTGEYVLSATVLEDGRATRQYDYTM